MTLLLLKQDYQKTRYFFDLLWRIMEALEASSLLRNDFTTGNTIGILNLLCKKRIIPKDNKLSGYLNIV